MPTKFTPAFLALALGLCLPATALDYDPYCYIRGADGIVTDLEHLCPVSEATPTPPQRTTPQAPPATTTKTPEAPTIELVSASVGRTLFQRDANRTRVIARVVFDLAAADDMSATVAVSVSGEVAEVEVEPEDEPEAEEPPRDGEVKPV